MSCVLRRIVSIAIATSVLVAQPPASAPALAQPTITIDECRLIQDADVRDRVRELTEATLRAELEGLDYRLLVSARWPEAKMDEKIDAAVDDAIAVVRADKSWLDRAYSNFSTETAKRFATEVADRAYGSATFKNAITQLADLVGRDIGARIEAASQKVSGPVIACVQRALQTRYGDAMAQVFANETAQAVDVSGDTAGPRIDATDLAFESGGAIAGIILIVTRRVIARMVASIGARIAGAVATRIVSAFSGILGVILLAADLYTAGDGVFPLISEKMKSLESKDLIKTEIVKTLDTEVTQQLGAIGQETAERIYSLWLDFRQKYNKLLHLGDKNEAFAAFLKERKIEQLGRLGRIVDVVLAAEGEAGVFKRTADGSLNRALLDLSDDALLIAAHMKSLDAALQWSRLAGRDLEKVLRFEIYKSMAPGALTPEQFQKLIAIDDRTAVTRIAGLEPVARDMLLALPPAQLRELARRFEAAELKAFSDYQLKLQPAAARRIAKALGDNPNLMRTFAKPGVQSAILGSGDQLAAIDMLAGPSTPLPDFTRIWRNFEIVRDGRVEARVFFESYQYELIAAALILLFILLWLRKVLFVARRR